MTAEVGATNWQLAVLIQKWHLFKTKRKVQTEVNTELITQTDLLTCYLYISCDIVVCVCHIVESHAGVITTLALCNVVQL